MGTSGGPRAIGKYVHDVLECVGSAWLREEFCSDAVYEQAAAEASAQCEDPLALVEGARLIAAYRLRYGDEVAGWMGYELTGVERVLPAANLHTKLGGFASIADVVVRDDAGVWVCERKTAGRMPSGTEDLIVRGLRTWPQLLALGYCARDAYGDEYAGIVYDLITKTKQVGFLRLRIPRQDAELDAWAANQQSLEQLVGLDCQNLDACDPTVGFRCDYFDYCHGTEQDRETLYQIRLSA
jgi:hypothetical protein